MAGPGINISMIGDKKLVRDFNRLPSAIQRKAVRKAMRPAQKVILTKMKQLVPVDTGALKKSLKIRAIQRSRSKVGVYTKTGERADLGIAEDAHGYYPVAVEYGYKRGETVVPPQSYMRAAFDTKESEARRILISGLRNIVDEVMRGGKA